MTIKIVTDSTCDLPEEIIRDLDITVVPLYINIGDQGYLDGIDISRQDFYISLPDYPVHPTTGTPGSNAFLKAFEDLVAKGAEQILSIHISETLSATIDVARKAAEDFKKVPVAVRDSTQLSTGTGFQVEMAARMAKAGKNLSEIVSSLNNLADRTFVAAGLDTLEFLRRSGRMNRFMKGLGSLLQLKPILTMKNGLPGSDRVRTALKAEERLIAYIEEHLPLERIVLLHTNAQEKAQDFLKKIEKMLPEGEIPKLDITPVIGAHIGPGAVGFAIVSEETD